MLAKFGILYSVVLFLGAALAKADSSVLASLEGFTDQVLEIAVDNSTTQTAPLYVVLRKSSANQFDAFVAQSENSVSFYGLCLRAGEPCRKTATIKSAMLSTLAASSGRASVQSYVIEQFAKVQDQEISYTTVVEKVDENEIRVEMATVFSSVTLPLTTNVSLRRVSALSGKKIFFSSLTNDVSHRVPLKEVDQKKQKLRSAVFKIKTPDETKENLMGAGTGHGTGFFISGAGLALTNHHVIDGAQTCMRSLMCDLTIAMVESNGIEKEFKLKAHLLAAHPGYDIALLKFELPADLNSSFLEIEDSVIGADVFTLGFPGDRSDHVDGSLTYSFGHLTGFLRQVFTTSAYINFGASGSPLLNTQTGRVIGLLSNGSGEEERAGEGMPGMARPIGLIDQLLNIKAYVSNEKQKRVKAILESLSQALYSEGAKQLLTQLRAERTYLGTRELLELASAHPSVSVRKEIVTYLQNVGYIGFR